MIGAGLSSPLAAAWAKAGNLLGVEVIAPFLLQLSSGLRLDAAVLVKGFGAPNGMLLVTDYAEVRKHLNELETAGFGFSVLEGPEATDPFILDEFVDMLRDWGWRGRIEDAPSWITS